MAVIQISRIQHRKGLQQDLPQLASAELGWALDSRQLYIGNGTIAEGAPEIGVTEILTQYSDLLNISDAYTFRGSQSGYTSRTGPTTDQPITRTLQQKIDDYVNVRDFGAAGDGNTNDTAALQRAIDEVLFGNFALTTPRLRRVIHVPAGVYLITASLKLPSYITLQGEGKGRSIIRQSSNLYPVFQLKDSENKIDANYGTGSATVAQDISLQDLSIEHLSNQDLVRLDTTERVEFIGVTFKGSQSSPSTHLLTAQNAVFARPLSSSGYVRDVNFIDCDFYNCTQGVVLNATNVKFIGCNFKQLSQAVIVDTTATVVPTKNIKVISSSFDQIARTAILVTAANSLVVTSVMSSHNHYGEVGTVYTGPSSNVAFPVITFTGSGNYSVGDFFERPDADHVTKPRVQQGSTSVGMSIDANTGISMGMMTTSPARVISLSASQTTANTGIMFTGANTSATITYFLQRESAGAYRNGRIDIIRNGSDIQYVDEYVEYPDATNYTYPGPTGVTLAVESVSSTVARVVYTSSAAGTGNLTYSINSLRI
jgi:hypothetical protein